ncbi:hypothetical protein HDU76_005873 [Blyttiomyces sp. JEL0837]|nr:hypothetical protein HDU76_005873 [Blyttiomyces sp. JEL0837]
MAAPQPNLRFVDFFFQAGLPLNAKLSDCRVPEEQSDGPRASQTRSSVVRSRSTNSINAQKLRIETAVKSIGDVEKDDISDTSSLRNKKSMVDIDSIVSSRNSVVAEQKSMTPCTTKMKRAHPIAYRYQPEILCKYPAQDYSDKDKFPQYLPMFCFPNELSLRYEPDGPPPTTYHSFIITEESGTRTYGVCLTIYEKLHPNLLSQLETMCDEWRSECIAQSDIEYMHHIQKQLRVNEEAIVMAKKGIVDPRNDDEELEDIIAEAEEKVSLYKELLKPFARTALVEMEKVYAPRSIGLLSHWPWYDIFVDWLRELVKIVKGEYGPLANRGLLTYAPLESYLQAPMPYIIGVGRDYFTKAVELDCRPSDACLVDIDNNTIDNPSAAPTLPPKDRRKLLTRLGKYAVPPSVTGSNPNLQKDPSNNQTKGVPISVKLAYPNDKLISRCTISRRWLVQESENAYHAAQRSLSMAALKAKGGGLADNSKSALDSHAGVGGGAQIRNSNTGLQPPTPSLGETGTSNSSYFFPKFNRTLTNQMSVNTSLDSLQSSFVEATPKTGTGSGSNSIQLQRSNSVSAMGAARKSLPALDEIKPPSLEEKEEEDVFETVMLGMFGVGSRSEADVRRRTRSVSASTEMHDPTMPPLAPLVVSGDIPGQGYSGLPAGKSEGSLLDNEEPQSVTRRMSLSFDKLDSNSVKARRQSFFGAAAKQDDKGVNLTSIFTFGATSTPSRTTTMTRRRPLSYYSERNTIVSAPVDDAASQMSRTSHRPSIAPSVSSSATTSPSCVDPNSPIVSPSLESPQNKPEPRKVEGHSFVEVIMEALQAREVDIGEDTVGGGGVVVGGSFLAPPNGVGGASGESASGGSSGNSKEPTREPTPNGSRSFLSSSRFGSREMLSGSMGDISASHSTLGSMRKLGSSNMMKGDLVPKPDENSCRLCCDKLREEQDSVVLKCEYCNWTIHYNCLPMVDGSPCSSFFNEKKIQGSFFKVFTSIMKNYRTFLVVPDQVKRAAAANTASASDSQHSLTAAENVTTTQGMDLILDDWFKKDDFLASLDRDAKPFLMQLVETQAFAQFTLDRIERSESDYEVLFFDESIKAKLNRSRLKFSKETTPFLKDNAYSVRATVAAAFPNLEGLDPNKVYSTTYFPIALDTTLLSKPRIISPLVTQSDQRMMRSHTNELVNRARMASGMKRKQDFTKWMRTKLKHFQKIGGGEVVSLGFLSDEQRREMFEERLREVSDVIDRYEAAHLSSQTLEEVNAAIADLHAQHLVLMQAAEDELVDVSDQEELQVIYNRLFRAITIYEDHLQSLESSTAPYEHPLGALISDVNRDIVALGRAKEVKSVWKKVDKEVSLLSLPTSVRSRTSSLKSNGRNSSTGRHRAGSNSHNIGNRSNSSLANANGNSVGEGGSGGGSGAETPSLANVIIPRDMLLSLASGGGGGSNSSGHGSEHGSAGVGTGTTAGTSGGQASQQPFQGYINSLFSGFFKKEKDNVSVHTIDSQDDAPLVPKSKPTHSDAPRVTVVSASFDILDDGPHTGDNVTADESPLADDTPIRKKISLTTAPSPLIPSNLPSPSGGSVNEAETIEGAGSSDNAEVVNTIVDHPEPEPEPLLESIMGLSKLLETTRAMIPQEPREADEEKQEAVVEKGPQKSNPSSRRSSKKSAKRSSSKASSKPGSWHPSRTASFSK